MESKLKDISHCQSIENWGILSYMLKFHGHLKIKIQELSPMPMKIYEYVLDWNITTKNKQKYKNRIRLRWRDSNISFLETVLNKYQRSQMVKQYKWHNITFKILNFSVTTLSKNRKNTSVIS